MDLTVDLTVEFSTVTRSNGEVVYHVLSTQELEDLLKEAVEKGITANAEQS